MDNLIELDPLLNTTNTVESSELIRAAQDHNWDTVFNLIDDNAHPSYFTNTFSSHGRTILHYACEIANKIQAANIVKEILGQARKKNIATVGLIKFVNHADEKGKTALHISASERCANRNIVELLVFAGADVNLNGTVLLVPNRDKSNTEGITLINDNVRKALFTIFSHGLETTEENGEVNGVKCNFSPVVGVRGPAEDANSDKYPKDFLLCETKLLAVTFNACRVNRSEVLLHPLVRIFLHLKNEKFKWFIRVSILYHILWSAICIYWILTYCNFSPPEQANSNVEDYSSINNSGSDFGWKFSVGIFLLVTFIKESVEILLSHPYRLYYWKQLENIGQWVLMVCVLVLLFIFPFAQLGDPYTHTYLGKGVGTVGIFTATLLFLGQLNKVEKLGIFMEMIVVVLKQFLWFLVAFSPLLLAFSFSLYYLMPEKSQFSSAFIGLPKLLIMMTGEINYDETFHPEDTAEAVKWTIIAIPLYCIFTIVVTILLQNLLIGITVSDIQNLQRKGEEIHLATQLEQIYLIEKFILEWIQHWFKNKHLLKTLLLVMDPNKDRLEESCWMTYNFKEYQFPDEVRKSIIADTARKEEDLNKLDDLKSLCDHLTQLLQDLQQRTRQ